MTGQDTFWNTRGLTLRPAAVDDADAVKQLSCIAFEKYVDQIGRTPRVMLADYRQVIARDRVWVVDERAQLIAVLVLVINDTHYHINNIAVHPNNQRQGIGKALLRQAEAQSIHEGYGEIWLHTNETMVHNIRLYTSIGYQEMYRKAYPGSKSLYMRKTLKNNIADR
ncbi:MAG: GNAT family N-acetyltransferase [Cyanobacteria bacterium J06635_15]